MRHQAYLPPIVDESVVRKQAESRFKEDGTTTIIHKHRYREACLGSCYEWPRLT